MRYRFNVGDKVRVVRYGHPFWSRDTMDGLPLINVNKDSSGNDVYYYDLRPELIGREGIIDGRTNTQGVPQYSIDGIKGKHAWYHESQLEIIYSILQHGRKEK